MKKNLNSPEGIFRLILAASCFYILYLLEEDWKIILMMLTGLFFFCTGIWRICPVYRALKISTIRKPARKVKTYR